MLSVHGVPFQLERGCREGSSGTHKQSRERILAKELCVDDGWSNAHSKFRQNRNLQIRNSNGGDPLSLGGFLVARGMISSFWNSGELVWIRLGLLILGGWFAFSRFKKRAKKKQERGVVRFQKSAVDPHSTL